MGLTVYNMKKWSRMMIGKSEMHVNQSLGAHFVPGIVSGYFNSMTEKVLKEPYLVNSEELPMNHSETGDVVFPVTIFQYGLGLYDLFLENDDVRYMDKFMQLANWAINNQATNGAWDNFGFFQSEAPYGSMCQGEGASLLVRAYHYTKNGIYLDAAQKAIDFMLLPRSEGGTSDYTGGELTLYEFTNRPIVLNGWIFSLYGIYDLNIVLCNKEYEEALKMTVESLKNHLYRYDNGYWSMYDEGNIIASPFYHKLHISQLEALELTFNEEVFGVYKNRFAQYSLSKWNSVRAFVIKAYQKIKE